MTRDEIIKMAKEAGLYSGYGHYFIEDATPWMIERFAALVAQAEREDCAKVCEDQITGSDYHFLATNGRFDHMAQASVNCADAIRARSNKGEL